MCGNFVLCQVCMNACCLCFIQTCLYVWFVQCLSCLVGQNQSTSPNGNSTLVLANGLITTFTPKSHMHLTGPHIYTNRCTEVGIQKLNSNNVTLVFNQGCVQLLPGVC